MIIRRVWETTKVAAQVVFGCAIVAVCGYSGHETVVKPWNHRHEALYLMPRGYDPLLRNLPGIWRSDISCSSPAQCEPGGKPSPQHFVLLREYEVREWGFDPANEIPVTGNPYY